MPLLPVASRATVFNPARGRILPLFARNFNLTNPFPKNSHQLGFNFKPQFFCIVIIPAPNHRLNLTQTSLPLFQKHAQNLLNFDPACQHNIFVPKFYLAIFILLFVVLLIGSAGYTIQPFLIV